MTKTLLLGQRRPEAACFSLLLLIPTTVAAGFLGAMDLVFTHYPALQTEALIAGGLAFLGVLAEIARLMGWLRRESVAPFVIYRLVLVAMLALADRLSIPSSWSATLGLPVETGEVAGGSKQ